MMDCVFLPYSPLFYPSLIYLICSIHPSFSIPHPCLFQPSLHASLAHSSLPLSFFSLLNPTLSPFLPYYLCFLPHHLFIFWLKIARAVYGANRDNTHPPIYPCNQPYRTLQLSNNFPAQIIFLLSIYPSIFTSIQSLIHLICKKTTNSREH